ncbi:hypothetical protein [Pedobacter sp. MW01-1-1]|uniref:hypothetical protein n=1 Tax=Pedobacter sp. MW01-1-1 TaxID=3383027 RepID=UPI003FEDAC3A
MSELKKAVQRLSKSNTGFDAFIELAIVKTVNEMEATCDVVLFENEDLLLEGVKLKPIVPGIDLTEMGTISYPEINSKVLIGQINNDENDLFVVMTSKVKKITLDVGSLFKMALDMQSGSMALNLAKGLIFNGGKKGGLPMASPIVDKINQLEKTVNDLATAFNDHTHAGVAVGGATTPPPVKKASKINALTVLNEIENTAIKQ